VIRHASKKNRRGGEAAVQKATDHLGGLITSKNSHHSRRDSANCTRFFTIANVAESLSVSTRTVRRWIDSGQLVTHRFKSTLRIAEADLQAFLARHRDD
jgi:excisionase family DNA binding protein